MEILGYLENRKGGVKSKITGTTLLGRKQLQCNALSGYLITE